ncbi:hypothetical protein [Nocardioides sp. L-11A]|uniref:hypothetical protein n=1 Tax=Nocardioides sp. L-11A TaxID=3043848 RepID=UPI00249B1E5E|nr:hypothetical protein QJ852_23955 [Nocardioides sp. L-11A]
MPLPLRAPTRVLITLLSCVTLLLAVPAPADAEQKTVRDRDPSEGVRRIIDIRSVRYVSEPTYYEAVVHIPKLRRSPRVGIDLHVTKCGFSAEPCAEDWYGAVAFDVQGRPSARLYSTRWGSAGPDDCPGINAQVRRHRVTIRIPNGCAGSLGPSGNPVRMRATSYLQNSNVLELPPSIVGWPKDVAPARVLHH